MTAKRFDTMTQDERREHLATISKVLGRALGGSALDPDWKLKEAVLLQQTLERGESKK